MPAVIQTAHELPFKFLMPLDAKMPKKDKTRSFLDCFPMFHYDFQVYDNPTLLKFHLESGQRKACKKTFSSLAFQVLVTQSFYRVKPISRSFQDYSRISGNTVCVQLW